MLALGSKEVYELISSLDSDLTSSYQIEKGDIIRERNMSTRNERKHQPHGAIYTSRLMPNISKGNQFLHIE